MENQTGTAEKQKATLRKFGIGRFVNKTTVSVAVIYAIITIIVFNPVFASISNTIPGVGGDPFQNLLGLWWPGFALLNLHTSMFYSYMIFWPIGVNMLYQTLSPLVGLTSLPFQAFGLVTAYNIMLVIGMTASALGMFVLAKYVSKNNYAAFIAGAFYAFSAGHMAQAYGHMHWIDIGFIPVLIYFLLKALDEQKLKGNYLNALGIGISFVLITFLGGYEKAVMTIMLVVLVVVLYAIYSKTRKKVLRPNFWIALVIAVAVAAVLGSWGFIPLVHALSSKSGLSLAQSLNNVTYNEMWSNNLISFFVPSYYNGIFNPSASISYFPKTFQPDPTEKVGYIGYVALMLALYGVYIDIKANRKRYLLWAAIAVLFAWLSIGPVLQIGGDVTSIPGIYAAYHAIPGINIVREPGRFFIIGTIGLDVLAALGLAHIIDSGKIKLLRSKNANALLICGIVLLLFIVGSSGIPHTAAASGAISMKVPPGAFYKKLASVNGTFSVLQLPILQDYNSSEPLLYEGEADYFAALSHKPFIGGYPGRENTTQLVSVYNIPLAVQVQNLQDGNGFSYASPIAENYSNQTLLTLYNYQTAVVSVEKSAFTSTQLLGLESYLDGLFGAPIYNGNNTIAFDARQAEADTAYKSYVAYPYLPSWGAVVVPYNGSDYNMFVPLNYSPVIVYAPYLNYTNAAASSIQHVSTEVSFSAIAEAPGSSLIVESATPAGYKKLADFNISDSMSSYSFAANMTSGPYGNEFLFISSEAYGKPTVYLSSMRFTRG